MDSAFDKKLKKWPCRLFKLNHTCHQKPNPSREAVPLTDYRISDYVSEAGHRRELYYLVEEMWAAGMAEGVVLPMQDEEGEGDALQVVPDRS